MTTKLDKVLYTAKAHTTGGRDGRSVTDDGLLNVKLSPPKAMGGAGNATNPEQLFAAGPYSAGWSPRPCPCKYSARPNGS